MRQNEYEVLLRSAVFLGLGGSQESQPTIILLWPGVCLGSSFPIKNALYAPPKFLSFSKISVLAGLQMLQLHSLSLEKNILLQMTHA